MQKVNVRKMVLTAVLGTMAFVLHLMRFPLPFMPPFMDYDLSGIPEMIGAFTLGPVSGVTIIVLKNLLKLMIQGTGSAFTGELQNLILSCAYILPACFIFQRGKTRKSALIGTIVGTIICAITAVFTNMYIIIPFFAKAFGFTMDQVIASTQAVNKYVTSPAMFIALGIVPFNLIKGGVTAALAYASYPVLMRIATGGKTDAV